MFKFKDVDVTFDMRKLPKYDQEYLKTMAYEMIQSPSFLHSGKSFNQKYPGAANFMYFDNFNKMASAMSEFNDGWHYYVSHLLHGRKYWLAWTFRSKEN